MKNPKLLNLRRYHKNIHFPRDIRDMCFDFFNQLKTVGATHHAVIQMQEDRRGSIPMPTKEQLTNPNNTLVEFYEILNHRNQPTSLIQKMVIRCHDLSSEYDYTYVVAREGFIVSSWANDKNDDHRLTCKYNLYYKPGAT
jgi:hypothetical protein